MSGIDPTKTDLDVAESNQVAVVYGAGFTVGDSLTVDVGPIRRTSVGDHESSQTIHFDRCMDFRDARVIQMQIVVGGAAYIEPAPAGYEFEGNFAREIRRRDANTKYYLQLVAVNGLLRGVLADLTGEVFLL